MTEIPPEPEGVPTSEELANVMRLRLEPDNTAEAPLDEQPQTDQEEPQEEPNEGEQQ